MELIHHPEMLVTSYKPTPRNIQGEQRPHDFTLSPGYYEQSLALYQCDWIQQSYLCFHFRSGSLPFLPVQQKPKLLMVLLVDTFKGLEGMEVQFHSCFISSPGGSDGQLNSFTAVHHRKSPLHSCNRRLEVPLSIYKSVLIYMEWRIMKMINKILWICYNAP